MFYLNVVNLEKVIESRNIPSYLLYACRFWEVHLHDGGFVAEVAQSVSGFIRGNTVDLIRLNFDPLRLDYLAIRRQVTT